MRDNKGSLGRILALDYGKKRIGLAITDGLGITAQGLDTLERTRVRDDIQKLSALAQEREVELLLFGDPVHLSGEAGTASKGVREFAERLQRACGLPIQFWDERLTSYEAHEVLSEMRVPPDKRKGMVDRIAAVLLLRSYLESQSA